MEKLTTTCGYVRSVAYRHSKVNAAGYIDQYISIKERYENYCDITEKMPQLSMTYEQFRWRIDCYEKFMKKASNFPNCNCNGEKELFLK